MSVTPGSPVERSTTRKVFWRIVPYCFGLYVISYIDRANIGYATLQMNKELAPQPRGARSRTACLMPPIVQRLRVNSNRRRRTRVMTWCPTAR